MLNNKAFCVLPFYGIEYPTNTPCCLLPFNTDLDQVKKDMLAGIRPAACQKCWNLEDAGIKSDRLIKNETLDFYLDRDVNFLLEDCKQGKNSVLQYKIETSKVCNGTCITCGSGSSSAWAQLERNNKNTPKKTWHIESVEAELYVDYKSAKSIGFFGGEPFLSTTNFLILEKLIEAKNTDCHVSFVTNGSFEMTEYQKDLISKFKNINLCFSIDGVGPVFEYLRYPLKWKDLEKNILYCKQHNIMISVSYTISNLNIFYHDQTIEWFNKNELRFIINPVYNPVYFKSSSLPESIKNVILQKNSADINPFLTHCDNDDTNYILFKRKIAEQNLWKKIKMKDYIPEFAKLIQFND